MVEYINIHIFILYHKFSITLIKFDDSGSISARVTALESAGSGLTDTQSTQLTTIYNYVNTLQTVHGIDTGKTVLLTNSYGSTTLSYTTTKDYTYIIAFAGACGYNIHVNRTLTITGTYDSRFYYVGADTQNAYAILVNPKSGCGISSTINPNAGYLSGMTVIGVTD